MCLSGFICISLTTLLCSQELTDTTRPEGGVKLFEYPVFSTTEPGVQCGLYALFAASNSLGSQIPLGEALSGKSFQNKNGLSAADIAGIARRFGLQSCVYFNLAPATLTAAKGPVILLIDDSAGADGATIGSLLWACAVTGFQYTTQSAVPKKYPWLNWFRDGMVRASKSVREMNLW